MLLQCRRLGRQALAEVTPGIDSRLIEGDGEAEGSRFPWCRKDQLTVLAWQGDLLVHGGNTWIRRCCHGSSPRYGGRGLRFGNPNHGIARHQGDELGFVHVLCAGWPLREDHV